MDAFGRITDDPEPAFVQPIGFAGGVEDETTGGGWFGHRDYAPPTARWTALDPEDRGFAPDPGERGEDRKVTEEMGGKQQQEATWNLAARVRSSWERATRSLSPCP